jgi:tetratricopeptide (TPR) repeat protein
MNMFATHNYVVRGRPRLPVLTLLAAVGFAAGADLCRAQESGQRRSATPLARSQTVFIAALKQYEAELTNNLAAGEFARAAFERAEFSTNDTERAALAVQGIAACRKLIARDPKSAPGHYYLGLNLGQMARTKLLGALKIVDEMEREFKTARVLDQQLDHAGPDRCLGLLYYEAPAIGSVGSRSKARKHLERAAELAPDFPPNRLSLAEAYFKWRDKNPLKRELTALEKLWPVAKVSFPDADWPAWSRRRQKLETDAAALLNR